MKYRIMALAMSCTIMSPLAGLPAQADTGLAEAVRTCNVAAISAETKAGADLNQVMVSGSNTLTFAAGNCNRETVQVLINGKADPNAKDSHGMTPLFSALNRSPFDESIMLTLINAGANVNARDDIEQTPLMVAIKKGYIGVLRPLIAAKADLNTKDKYGNTPMIMAIKSGRPEVALTLIKLGADRNARDAYQKTALLLAMSKRYTKVSSALIAGGADTGAKDANGHTPLIFALNHGYRHESLILVQRLADVNARDTMSGQTALMIASKKGYSELVSAMIKARAGVNLTDNKHNTAIKLARQNGHTNVARLLRRAGATG